MPAPGCPDEHLRGEPVPPRPPRLRRAGDRAERRGGRPWPARRGPVRRRVDGAVRRPPGAVRPCQAEDAFEAYAEQAAALADGGVDLLVDRDADGPARVGAGVLAARHGRSRARGPRERRRSRVTTARCWARPRHRSPHGWSSSSADAIGANCGEGPAQVLRVVRAMRPVRRRRPARPPARTRAGPPRSAAGFVYPATPDYLAELCPRVPGRRRRRSSVGVAAPAPRTRPRSRRRSGTVARPRVGRDRASPTGPRTSPGRRRRPRPWLKLSRRDFVVAVEMEPPRSFDAAALVAAAADAARARAPT